MRFGELETKLADPAIYTDHRELKRISLEHRKLGTLFDDFSHWETTLQEMADNREMFNAEEDEELKTMAAEEIARLEQEAAQLEKNVRLALLPPDPNDTRNIIIEIRPAAGGDESALFAAELYRLYTRYAETRGWKCETLDFSNSDLGGIKEAVFSLSGDGVFSRMKYESGVHRVQRVPVTEAQGRVHTSTVTVAVMPEAEEVELELKPDELRIDVFRSSGPGGQCVNTTDSAVRVTHIPTGVSVASQQEKSQHRNKEIAMRILRARLLEHLQQEENAKHAATKRAQVGTGDRSERIRTYNFPQNRVTDHRYNVTLYNLPSLLEGDLDSLLDEIIAIDCDRRLASLTEDAS
ncbi:MAG: peptide chain release factor 1 [Victivallales bacterium]|nr:peptide chain release factor 1 [Victivallales bacterium]